jgi:hypothetical protein
MPVSLYGGLLHCPGLVVLARDARKSQNIGINKILTPAKISLIFTKFQQSLSLLLGVLSKNHRGKRCSLKLSNFSFSTLDHRLEAVTMILHCLWKLQ